MSYNPSNGSCEADRSCHSSCQYDEFIPGKSISYAPGHRGKAFISSLHRRVIVVRVIESMRRSRSATVGMNQWLKLSFKNLVQTHTREAIEALD